MAGHVAHGTLSGDGHSVEMDAIEDAHTMRRTQPQTTYLVLCDIDNTQSAQPISHGELVHRTAIDNQGGDMRLRQYQCHDNKDQSLDKMQWTRFLVCKQVINIVNLSQN